jgi:hypothetical protein
MPLHEDGVERPIEILACPDPRRLDRRDRIDDGAGPDRQPGRPQRAPEVRNVVGQPPTLPFLTLP